VRIYGNILNDDHGITMGYMYFMIDISQQKRSLALAGEVQKSLLPQQSPRVKGFDIAGRTLSCDEIGGDYFDYLLEQQCSQPHLDIIVGDVTGHGVEAALLMTSARAVLRMKAQTSPCQPVSQIATEINRYLVRDVLDTGRFMTMFYLRIALNEGRIGWVRAGHPAAVVYSPAKDRFRELMGQGLALGLDPAYAYQENTAPGIAAGDIVAIGTDGIWETVDRVQEPYGKKRFYEVIRKNAALSAEEIMDAVYTDLKRFSLGTMQEDDITLVIVKSNRDRFGPIDYQI
jgi:sigma-B regulation protein RsbU (phosphoserine phosphatase)